MLHSIKSQTGWARPHPLTICQDCYVLACVTEYDFDLYNADFVKYCDSRGVKQRAGLGKRFAFTANHSASKAQFFKEFAHAEGQADGSAYKYTEKEMKLHWQIMLTAKGAMQDCWEVFKLNA